MLLLEKSQKQVGPVLDIIARLTVCPFDRENRASGALFCGNAMPFSKPAGNTMPSNLASHLEQRFLILSYVTVSEILLTNDSKKVADLIRRRTLACGA